MGCSSCALASACGIKGGESRGCGSNGGCSSGAGCSRNASLHIYDWLTEIGISSAAAVYDLVEVAFKGGRKGFYQNTANLDLQTGDYVVVSADRGVDFGTIHMMGEMVRLRVRTKGLDEETQFPNVVRLATGEDIDRWNANKEKEAETFLIGRRAIDRMNLPMKLVDVEWQFDHGKVTFYFTAEHRVDFRQLVRDLASRFRTRVELRQIGARDEAARIGGIGSCGLELCCSTWLQEFKPVSTQAAKVQNLPLNPVRLSGQCGRLKCCLNYELEQYMEALQEFPSVDTAITTERGSGVIQKLDIFQRSIWIEYTDGSWEEMELDEARLLLGMESSSPARDLRSASRNRRRTNGDQYN